MLLDLNGPVGFAALVLALVATSVSVVIGVVRPETGGTSVVLRRTLEDVTQPHTVHHNALLGCPAGRDSARARSLPCCLLRFNVVPGAPSQKAWPMLK